MGVKISKNVYSELNEYSRDDISIVNQTSKSKLEKLRRKRATCAAELSSEKPILLHGSRNKGPIYGSSSSRYIAGRDEAFRKGHSTGNKKKLHRRNIVREFDFSGRC